MNNLHTIEHKVALGVGPADSPKHSLEMPLPLPLLHVNNFNILCAVFVQNVTFCYYSHPFGAELWRIVFICRKMIIIFNFIIGHAIYIYIYFNEY